MTKKEAKEEIKRIVAKYERLALKDKKQYNEAMTRKDFILPLFHVLGWDVYNDSIVNEVKEEEPAVKGTVDYSFKLNNIPQFLLEAKAIKVDLDKTEWAKQAVSYGWNMGIEWVILTDFEGIKLFNASWKIDIPRPNLELTYKEYLDRFDDLWLFSKESFESGELDKQTGKWGIGVKRVDVTEKLANDLIEWREQLFGNFRQWNTDKSEEEIDEAVQRILDRFIFMRSCEDKKIEPPILWQNFQKWSQDMKERNFLKILKPVFKEFDENYNSNLFKEHLCDNFETEGDPFLKVISGLYGDKEAGVKYNFVAIKPDVLGKVYEQYLGHLLRKAGKRGEDLGKTKRKKQGIYYTPTFIVDYIVQNALGPVLDKCKTVRDLKKMKVLDPACGSGSFLIKALEMINEKYKKFGAPGNTHTKIQILMENIYGVDLDEQAVEITRLNLLLNALEKQFKFPLLNNIKNGNSLISGTDEELEKYFGKKFKEKKKPFNWEEQFPEVFKQGGFDVVIGNPPYTSFYSKQAIPIEPDLMEYFLNNFDFIKKDKGKPRIGTVMLFLEKAHSLLKKNGRLGFITDLNIFEYPSIQIRKFITERADIQKIVYGLSDFYGVGSGQCILIIQKNKSQYAETKFYNGLDDKIPKIGNKTIWLNDKDCRWEPQNTHKEILEKIEKNSILLEKLCEVITGVAVNATPEGKKFFISKNHRQNSFPLLEGSKGVKSRYCVVKPTSALIYNKELEAKLNDEFDRRYFKRKGSHQRPFNIRKIGEFDRPKIFLRQSDTKFTATFSRDLIFGNYSLFNIFDKNNNTSLLKYILAVINSKVATFYGIQKDIILIKRGKTPQIRSGQRGPRGIRQLPMPIISREKRADVVKKIDKILKLNEELEKNTENSEKWNSIKSEIEKTDKKIDQEVYKLYGLTPAEIKIVEGN